MAAHETLRLRAQGDPFTHFQAARQKSFKYSDFEHSMSRSLTFIHSQETTVTAFTKFRTEHINVETWKQNQPRYSLLLTLLISSRIIVFNFHIYMSLKPSLRKVSCKVCGFQKMGDNKIDSDNKLTATNIKFSYHTHLLPTYVEEIYRNRQ